MRLLLRAVALCMIVGITADVCAATSFPRAVLIIDQSGPGTLNPGYAEISRTFRSTVLGKMSVRIYAENLDLNNFFGAGYEAKIKRYLADKYTDVPIGMLLCVGSAALEFGLHMQAERWPDTPIITAAADEASVTKALSGTKSRNITGRTLQFSLAKTLDVARVLVPGLRQIVLVGDPLEKQPFRRHFRDELPRLAANLILDDLTGRPLEEVKERVSSLPKDAAIIYTAMTIDGVGRDYLPYEAVEAIAKVANRPIVVDVDNRIGRGGTGGPVVRPDVIGREAAQIALQIFDGQDAAQIPITASDAIRPVFDWRELRRWGIGTRTLPPQSELRFYQPTIWEQYRWRIVLVLAAIVLQSVLIVGLVYEDRRRRAAEGRGRVLLSELAHMNRVATAGELTATLAHEIRQPLAAIIMHGNAGLNWLQNKIPNLQEAKVALQNIVDDGHRADDVIKSTRAIFRKDSSPDAVVDVNEMIEQVLALTAARLEASNITLDRRYARVLPPLVAGNAVQLQQVLLNLIMNAIEAMAASPSGDRILILRTEVDPDDGVSITVEDSGPGVDPQTIEQIFKPFFTTKPDGMGLGLAICKSVVEAHGGRLTAGLSQPRGMRFQIVLPRFNPQDRQPTFQSANTSA